MPEENVDYNETEQAAPSVLIYGGLDGVVTDTNAISIAGHISGQGTLYINGEEIEVREDGGFSRYYKLQYGENEFTIATVGENGNSTEYTSVITREMQPKQDKMPFFVCIAGVIVLTVGILSVVMDRRERNSKETKEKKESEKKRQFRFKLTYENIFHICLLILPFIIAYIMTNVLFLFATVVSGSMSPTIRTGDYVIVNRLAYIVNEPERGDIVSFSNKEINEHMIKRVIGLPGDFIQLINGDIYINGELLVEDYLKPGTETYPLLLNNEFHVPDNCYFMLGDNRGHSTDSRYWQNPYIPKEDIAGELMVIW